MGREDEGTSSLRPELAAIARTLQAIPLETDLLYLCDGEAALNRMSRWIGSGPRTTLAGDPNADIVDCNIDRRVDESESAEGSAYFHGQSDGASRRASQ